jgi:hypothetical protein
MTIHHIDLDGAIGFARDLARHDDPKFAEMGRKLLSIKSDEQLLKAVELIQLVIAYRQLQ